MAFIFQRLLQLFRRRRFEADMAEELQAHLEMQAAANRAAGMDVDEARYAARRQFGGVDQVKETARAQRAGVWLETVGQDFLFGLRSLRRSPGFTAVAVLTLMLGIGATTAIFSLVHGLLLRPLPIADQAGVIMISEATRQNPSMSVAYPNFLDWNERQHSFTALGAVRTQDVNITNRGDPERVSGAMVSHDFFAALGVQPGQGRLFRVTEDQPGAARAVLIRASLCRRRFGDPADALGQTLALDGQAYTVIGILPEAFAFPANATEVWLPLGLWADDYRNRRQHPGLRVIGRLRPGANLDSARADLAAIADQLAREYPDSNRGNGVQLQPLTDYLYKDVRPAMAVLSGAVACVLLIACANVAGLLLVRATVRRREFAIRVALGAGRGRLVRLLLVESLVLGLAGALGGFLVSFGLVDAIKSLLPAATPRLAQVGVDTTVLAFSAIAGVVTGLLLGLLPAWRASRPDLAGELAHASRNLSPGAQRGRAVLVAGEFALAVVLLLGAGLMLRTLHRLLGNDLGFARDRVLTFSYDLPGYAFSGTAARLEAEQRIVPRLAALPGVEAVGYSSALPLSNRANFNGFTIEGTVGNTPSELPMADTANISPGFFAALGISVLQGRNFSDADQPNTPRVAIIDTLFAARHFPGQNPIGRRLKIGDAASDLPWMEIVGVVAHIEKYGVDRDTGPQLYRPARQAPGVPSFTFALRLAASPPGAGGDAVEPTALAAGVRQIFREISPTVPVFDFQTMSQRFTASIWSRRLTAVLLGLFAGLAAVLAMVGLDGVLTYAVAQRTRELGIRLALGANPHDLVRQVVRQGMLLASIGIAIGLVASFGVAQALRGLLYGISPLDPASFIAVAAIALATGALSCWIPARRAAKVDPVVALRAE